MTSSDFIFPGGMLVPPAKAGEAVREIVPNNIKDANRRSLMGKSFQTGLLCIGLRNTRHADPDSVKSSVRENCLLGASPILRTFCTWPLPFNPRRFRMRPDEMPIFAR